MTSEEADDERDKRIQNEVIVDAYTPDEQAIGWLYYLERKITFPFQAKCIEQRVISPLEEEEIVCVVGMIDEVISEMFVRIEWWTGSSVSPCRSWNQSIQIVTPKKRSMTGTTGRATGFESGSLAQLFIGKP